MNKAISLCVPRGNLKNFSRDITKNHEIALHNAESRCRTTLLIGLVEARVPPCFYLFLIFSDRACRRESTFSLDLFVTVLLNPKRSNLNFRRWSVMRIFNIGMSWHTTCPTSLLALPPSGRAASHGRLSVPTRSAAALVRLDFPCAELKDRAVASRSRCYGAFP